MKKRMKKRAKRQYTPEQMEKLRENMAKARAARRQEKRDQALADTFSSANDISAATGSGINSRLETGGNPDSPLNDPRIPALGASRRSEGRDIVSRGGADTVAAESNLPAAANGVSEGSFHLTSGAPAAAGDNLSGGVGARHAQDVPGPGMGSPVALGKAKNERHCDLSPVSGTSDPPAQNLSASAPIEMQVSGLPQNPKLALARHPDYAGDQHVIVGQNDMFVIGMKLPVVRHPLHKAYWTLACPLPRMRGRW